MSHKPGTFGYALVWGILSRRLNNLASCLAAAGALAAERAKGHNEGWGAGWDAAERYTRNPGWRMGTL